MALLLRDMGVKNHAFILALHNPELKDVDPFDPDLTMEQIGLIAEEVKENPWYYFRECVRVPGGDSDDPIQFRANRGNIAVFWLFFNHITTILIQPRQTGKSFSIDQLMTWILHIGGKKTDITMLTKDETLRAANLTRLKDIEKEMPFYLNRRLPGDVGNTEEIRLSRFKNRYRGLLNRSSPKDALGVGRGLTSGVVQIDEAAFFRNISISMPAALAASIAAREMAKSRGTPYGIILTTTAGKKDDVDGMYVYKLVENASVWNERFYDAVNLKDLEQMIIKSSGSETKDIMVNCTFSHRQLGYDDNWLLDAIRMTKAKGLDADRDLFNVWTSGSQLSPLPIPVLEIIRKSQAEEFFMQVSGEERYIARWYIPENEIERTMRSGKFVMSVDPSDAGGGDDIGMTIRCIKTGEVVCAGNYNETNLFNFSSWLADWLVKYENITLIVERRSSGAMILDYLLLILPTKDIDPFKRLFNWVVHEAAEKPERFKECTISMRARDINLYNKYKKMFGFATSAGGSTSRSDLYDKTLRNSAKLCGHTVRDKKLIEQILGLVIRNNRVDHEVGKKDDLCISWLLGFWFMSMAQNLDHYGINPRDVLSENKEIIKETTPMALYERERIQKIRNKINYLIDQLKMESDEYVAYRYEQDLKFTVSLLDEKDRQLLSIDELILNLKEHRKQTSVYRRAA